MKRLFLLFIAFLLILCGCAREKQSFKLPQRGRFEVVEENGGISFTAVLDGSFAEFNFTGPDTIKGLSAKTNDGAVYVLSFGGIETDVTGLPVKAACDFAAALELLGEGFEQNGGTLYAEAGGVYAEAETEDGNLTAITFFGGAKKRKYKIKTEA